MLVIPPQVEGKKPRLVFDCETYRMQPGIAAPKVVCLAYRTADGTAGLLNRPYAVDFMHAHLARPDVLWVGQNIAYDFTVMAAQDIDLLPQIAKAYDENRVIDVRIRDKLLLLAIGQLADEGETGAKRQAKFSLDQIVLRRFGHRLTDAQKEKLLKEKKDKNSWRLRYGELDGVPVEEWPADAREYPLDDVMWADEILLDQVREQKEKTGAGYIPDEYAQGRAAFWLQLARVWGVRTEAGRVERLAATLSERLEQIDGILKRSGILRGKHKKGRVHWSKDMTRLRNLVVQGYGDKLSDKQRTDSGLIATDRDTLLQVPAAHKPGCKLAREIDGVHEDGHCEDDCIVGVLHAVADRNAVEKILNTYIPALMQGTTVPICPQWNELVASGRTSCFDPNFQNPPRKGEVRDCVHPRPGFWYVSCDYSFIELCSLAQVCLDQFGFSALADAINRGLDPHLDMAAELLGISYQEALARKKDPIVKEHRQMSKALNFGLPGGLGAEKFVLYARDSYGVILTVERAKELKPLWQRKWPEMVSYHRRIANKTAMGQTFVLTQHRSNRLRGDCGFTDGANSYFQGLAADGAKHAGWLIAKECYLPDPYFDGKGPTDLYGSRIVLFLHDEFILEVPEHRASDASKRLAQVMVDGMRKFIPDVTVKAEPALMRRWIKEAEPVYTPSGLLIPWEDRKLLGVAA